MKPPGGRWVDAFWGALASMAAIVPMTWFLLTAPVKPFKNVEVLQFDQVGSEVFITANFEKNDGCTFVDLKVFGRDFGQWHVLPWADQEVSQGDRLVGRQTLRIVVDTLGRSFDVIEVRTRHMCGDQKTDRIFLSKEL